MDLHIKNAMIYDGSGADPFLGGVLIKGDKIYEVGNFETDIPAYDAACKMLCPGFVDIHRHCDVKPLTSWTAEAELRQGITSVVCGNCGISLTPSSADFKDEQYAFAAAVLGKIPTGTPLTYESYLKSIKALPLNLGVMLGTGSVRISLKGFDSAPFTQAELESARAIIENALSLGAPGISVGIMYTPECFTSREEFVKMLSPLGKYGRVLTAHIRGEGDSLAESVREAVEIAGAVGCPLEISHFKSCGMKNWGREIFKAIDIIEKALSRGEDISCDFYPYCGGSTMLTTMLPPALCQNGTDAACRKLGTRQGLEEFIKAVSLPYDNWDNYALSLGWDKILVSSVSHDENKKFLGISITHGAEKFGFKSPEELAAHLMHTEGGGCGIINMSMLQSDVDEIAKLPYSSVISDALYADTSTPHPRLLGAFPKFLREYAFERGVVTMQESIKKMTSKPAKRMKLINRGLIKKGYFADLLIFDREKFTDNADFSGRSNMASGLSLCLVNGEIAVENDVLTNKNHGRLLKGGSI